MTTTHYFEAMTKTLVDKKDGVIRSAALITKGEAKGHTDENGLPMVIDETTLAQIFSECQKSGSVKVKADHGSGVMATVGYADNFALTAEKVTADIHFYESEPQRARLLEIAEKNPTHIGISMEFSGDDVSNGKECLARCNKIYAAAVVSDPAANKSLFSVPNKGADQEPQTNKQTNMEPQETEKEPTLKECMEMIKDFGARLAALETQPTAVVTNDDEKDMADGDVDPVATNPKDKLAGNTDDKTYTDKDVEKIAEMAAKRSAEITVKAFAAQMGVTQLSKAGSATAPKTKHFAEHVADVAIAKFGGDQVKATAHILSNKSAYGEAWEAYKNQRPVTNS